MSELTVTYRKNTHSINYIEKLFKAKYYLSLLHKHIGLWILICNRWDIYLSNCLLNRDVLRKNIVEYYFYMQTVTMINF